MRRPRVILGLVWLLASPAFAVPHLTADVYAPPEILPDYFKITPDRGPVISSSARPALEAVGRRLYFDMALVPDGATELTVQACAFTSAGEADRCSPPVAYLLVSQPPSVVGNLWNDMREAFYPGLHALAFIAIGLLLIFAPILWLLRRRDDDERLDLGVRSMGSDPVLVSQEPRPGTHRQGWRTMDETGELAGHCEAGASAHHGKALR